MHQIVSLWCDECVCALRSWDTLRSISLLCLTRRFVGVGVLGKIGLFCPAAVGFYASLRLARGVFEVALGLLWPGSGVDPARAVGEWGAGTSRGEVRRECFSAVLPETRRLYVCALRLRERMRPHVFPLKKGFCFYSLDHFVYCHCWYLFMFWCFLFSVCAVRQWKPMMFVGGAVSLMCLLRVLFVRWPFSLCQARNCAGRPSVTAAGRRRAGGAFRHFVLGM
ncbi:unnamed protein product [Trypanosoma congolense IL3000]|uniref:WGS project CAEQ00000000 data, annotated contig 488 n=1 Tax=Trypanosoma congolense (strain IL3000) TaxID=1068625 RepID=F9WGC1_TRYCI|nr:unnamed protein product [Trypanosoma congolense IL3000]